MPSVTGGSKPKGMKKKSFGSVRARAGLPAKAGKRHMPVGLSHTTSPEYRAAAKFLSATFGGREKELGKKHHEKLIQQIIAANTAARTNTLF